MIYKATFEHLRIFLAFLSVLAVGVIMLGVIMHTVLLIILGLLVLAYLCGARYLRSITLTDRGIEFKGVVKRWSVDWQEILYVKKLKEYGWPIDRMFGEFTYEIRTGHGRRIVNFLFFHGDCLSQIKQKTRPNKALQRIAQKTGSR
jgi:uncharacterized protein (DUF58 family)